MINLSLIMRTVAGSHLYGTNIETSDIDYRGVAFEPVESLLGLNPFEQFITPASVGLDETIFGLRKFTQLALDNNPNIVELLFAPKPLYENAYWREIVKVREYFLSRKIAKTFVGYAVSQAKRIEGHHRWMNGQPPVKPDGRDYGLMDIDGTPKWTDYNRKQAYENALIKYQQYKTWLDNRNPARHDLEEKWGYDTKHGMHLIRLLEQGKELLMHGTLTLPRPNALELLEVRNGSVRYETLMAWMEEQIDLIENNIVKNSVLPEKPNYNKVHDVVMNLNYLHIHRSYP
jgi:uncharacterized protein